MNKFKFLIVVLLFLILSSCSEIKEYGPFHYSALVQTPDYICETSKGKYCFLFGNIYEITNGTFIKKEIKVNKENNSGYINYLYGLTSSNDKIYIHTAYYIYIYDCNWSLEKRLNLSANHIFVDNNYLYYTNGNEPFNMINVYDLSTNEITKINITNNRVINLNEITLFVDNLGRIFKINENNDNKYIAKSHNVTLVKDKKMNFVINNNEYLFTFENNTLNVHSKDNHNRYDIKNCNMYYEKFFTKREKVYFATYEYLKNDECKFDSFCICQFGKSYIWCFDVNNNKLELVKEFKEGSHLISFNEEQYCYYYDGKIYLNDSVIKDIVKIQPQGEFYSHSIFSGSEDKFSSTLLFYDEEVYYLYNEYNNK